MSMSQGGDFDEDAAKRQYTKPHSGKHPIPTIQGYREHRKQIEGQLQDEEDAQQGPEDENKFKRAFDSAKAVIKDEDDPKSRHDPYPSSNHNYGDRPTAVPSDDTPGRDEDQDQCSLGDESDQCQCSQDDASSSDGEQKQGKTATEMVASTIDPKEKRKLMKKTTRHGKGREVTDPITHLPIIIHDQTEKDLASAPENEPEPGTEFFTATGPAGASKSEQELEAEQEKLQRGHNGMQKVFPPPDVGDMRRELATVYQQALYAGLGLISSISAFVFLVLHFRGQVYPQPSATMGIGCFAALTLGISWGMSRWISKKVNEIFEDGTWDAARREENAMLDTETELPESVQWLNRLFASIWPLINPDLFSSLIDMIEDVMQASLPRAIKMVSVDDMGQGNEAIRVLGIRWLPTGAASRPVNSQGRLKQPAQASQSERTDSQNRQQSDSDRNGSRGDENNSAPSKGQDQAAVHDMEGMQAEEGDFVNLEMAIAYRSRSSGKSIRSKAKNAHLYLKFYLPGGIPIPVWVELRGLIATLRLRLQLTPDPPFMSLCTLTFMGQPKASIACVPLSKHSLNLMDVPLISSFVQSAIDAALAEYVAPRSLTLDLKDMLVGEDFKKDTTSQGVVMVFIKQARGFKQGDGGVGPMEGSSDSYVTVSWGKFGKPVASTRIIEKEQNPDWHEWASILVTPQELNAEEKLRLQLWDSDKWSADDDLGRVQLDLKSLISNPETYNKLQDREDQFTGQDPDEEMPGALRWSVGYFAKTRITERQLEQQTVNEKIRTKEQLKEHVSEVAEHKLREAGKGPHDDELRQQKAQDYKELESDMIISAPPSGKFVSGVLSVQIHNITGLETQRLQKQSDEAGEREDESERADDLPDSYCTIILNQKKIYRTRTKPKNSKPFFNAGTERFIRDWRTAEIIISVQDSRERENDPLIGIIYLPLAKVFRERSQLMDNFPLVGGIGYGRARVSMVWRSVELQLPPNLIGWDYGTVEIRGPVKAKQGLPNELREHRIKIRTNLGRAKLYPEDGAWKHKSKNGTENAFLAVRKRYASALVIEFRESSFLQDNTTGFAVLWLQELVDEEESTVTLKVWKGRKASIQRASTCFGYNGMEEDEQPLGEVELTLKFWRGLSGYHKGYAASVKNGDMRNVMECLDTITDENLDNDEVDCEESETDLEDSTMEQKEGDIQAKKKLKVHTNDDSSASSGDEGDASASSLSLSNLKKAKKILRNPIEGSIDTATSVLAPGENDPDDGSRGLRNQLRDYKQHHKQLHRKHRGIMQWRVAREADYLGGKLSRLKGNVSGLFSHDEKDAGVETEV